MLEAPKDEIIKTIQSTARFEEKHALAKYDSICSAARDAAVFGRALPSNAIRIRLYIGSFDLFPSLKKLYAYFGLNPAVKQSGKFNGDNVHMSNRGSSLARRILHMIALNNQKVDKGSKSPVNPVIYDYYIRKCAGKKKEGCRWCRHA